MTRTVTQRTCICDRCKQTIDYYEWLDKYKPLRLFKRRKKLFFLKEYGSEVDLCETCYEELYAWFKKSKENIDNRV